MNQKFYCAYDIFGHGNYCHEDYVVKFAPSRDRAFLETNTEACDSWCSYGGLHGIGFGEDEVNELKEQGLTDEEVHEEEWRQAGDEVDVSVLSEEEFVAWLKSYVLDDEEISKILLDIESNVM